MITLKVLGLIELLAGGLLLVALELRSTRQENVDPRLRHRRRASNNRRVMLSVCGLVLVAVGLATQDRPAGAGQDRSDVLYCNAAHTACYHGAPR